MATVQKRRTDDIPEELKVTLKEYHCANCGRFLCLQAIVEGTIAIPCRRCKEMNVLDVHSGPDILTDRDS